MMKKRSIVLGGMKHCGKSTHAAKLADLLCCKFLDTDTLLEALYYERNGERLNSREIYRTEGEEFFRRLEAEVITILATESPLVPRRVIALGGGVPANPFIVVDELKSLGVFIYLAIDSDVAFSRVLSRGLPPFLQDKENPREAFAQLYAQRDKFYRNYADAILTIDGNESITSVSSRLQTLEIIDE